MPAACGCLPLPSPAFRVPEPFLRWLGAGDMRRVDDGISGRFELHPAWNIEPSERRVLAALLERDPYVAALPPQDTKEPVMGLGKKAKREAKAVKGKTKKDARKVKRKGKKTKNAAKH